MFLPGNIFDYFRKTVVKGIALWYNSNTRKGVVYASNLIICVRSPLFLRLVELFCYGESGVFFSTLNSFEKEVTIWEKWRNKFWLWCNR